jgi:hypothetical protein
MVQGRAWHQTVEGNYRQKIESQEDLPLSDMQESFANNFDEALDHEEVIFDKGEDPASLKDQGVLIVKAHHKVIAPKVRPSLVEEKFLISLGDDFPYDLLGFWDLVEKDGTVVDNKAWGKSRSQADIDSDLQLTVYSLGYRAGKQEIEKGLRIDAVVKTKIPKAIQLHTTRTNADCQWLLRLIEQVAQAIESGVFYPNPNGWHCSERFCGYYDKCHNLSSNPF